MGSGSTKPEAVMRVKKSPTTLGTNDGGFAPREDALTFALEDPTDAGLAMLPDQEVVAVPRGDRVAVEANAQILGWVPNQFAQRIRGARYDSAFVGQVVDVDLVARCVIVTLERRQQVS